MIPEILRIVRRGIKRRVGTRGEVKPPAPRRPRVGVDLKLNANGKHVNGIRTAGTQTGL